MAMQFDFFCGDERDIEILLIDSAGNPIDLTGWTTLTLTVKESPEESALVELIGTPSVNGQFTVSDATSGVVVVRIKAVDSLKFTKGAPLLAQLRYEIGDIKVSAPVIRLNAL